jgi:hypothetical protein
MSEPVVDLNTVVVTGTVQRVEYGNPVSWVELKIVGPREAVCFIAVHVGLDLLRTLYTLDPGMKVLVRGELAFTKGERPQHCLKAVDISKVDEAGRVLPEALVVSLLTHLCGGVERQRPVYLFSGGAGIQELGKHAANAVLVRAGVQLKSRQTASERTVAVTIEPGRVVGQHLFWLAKVPAAGVVDADAEAEDQPGSI